MNLCDGGCLYCETHGDPNRLPLVCIHGGNMDRRVWTPQVGAFAAEYYVVTYDVRGFGLSSPKDRPHQAHRDLLELLGALGIVSPVHVVGLSLGGRIAVDFALTARDRVRSLVLAAPGLSGWNWKPAEWIGILGAMQSIPNPACARAAVVETWLASPGMVPAMNQPQLRANLRAWVTDNAAALLRTDPDPDAPLDPPAVGRLRDIRVPTLVLVGSRDTPDIREIVDLVDRDVPGSRRMVYDQVGHIINLESDWQFNADVLTFLRAVP